MQTTDGHNRATLAHYGGFPQRARHSTRDPAAAVGEDAAQPMQRSSMQHTHTQRSSLSYPQPPCTYSLLYLPEAGWKSMVRPLPSPSSAAVRDAAPPALDIKPLFPTLSSAVDRRPRPSPPSMASKLKGSAALEAAAPLPASTIPFSNCTGPLRGGATAPPAPPPGPPSKSVSTLNRLAARSRSSSTASAAASSLSGPPPAPLRVGR